LRWYRERRGDPGRDGQGRRLRLLADEAFGMRGVGGGEDGGTRGADGVRASVVDGLRGAQTQTGMTVLNVKSPGRIPCLASVSLMELLGERRRFSVCHRPPHDVPAEHVEDEAVSHYCRQLSSARIRLPPRCPQAPVTAAIMSYLQCSHR
jgi:hypothetical protein